MFILERKKYHEDNKFELRASVFNRAQLEAVVESGITSIYIKKI